MKMYAFIPLALSLTVGLLFVAAWCLQWLWLVALVPLGVPAVSYWQAFGIWCLLCVVAALFRRSRR